MNKQSNSQFSYEEIQRFRQLINLIDKSVIDAPVTLGFFRNEYEKHIKKNRSAKYLSSVSLAFNHLEKYFKNQRILSAISLRDIELFIDELKMSAPKGYRVYYRNIKAAFNKAVDWGYISINNFVKVKLEKKQRNKPEYLDSVQLSAISCRINSVVVKDAVEVAFYTGIRLGELVNLRWGNVDFENGIITVGDDMFETKARKQRFVPMNESVMDVLGKIKDKSKNETGFIFSKDNGKSFTGDYFSKKFKSACREASVSEKIHWHSLRHSFASNLVMKGVPLYSVKELLGHESISTTEIYAHLNIEELKKAVKKL